MDESDFDLIRQLVERIRQMKSSALRAQSSHAMHEQLRDFQADLAEIRKEAIDDLVRNGMKQKDIADRLGVSHARVSQLAKAGPGPERALLAPRASQNATVTVAVVQKQETEKNRPSVVDTTFDAAMRVQALAHRWYLETKTEKVPPGGTVDLNRDNLVVMIGPRITPLIAQAISADPVIKWMQDDQGHWYIIDTKAGASYHSDFDGMPAGTEGSPPACYAHIGRIRRPDGRGSFLYLGGVHAPGTAGAVEVLCRDISTLWEKVHRNPWSAVVKTTANRDETIISAEIITPIYAHGKGR